MARKVISVDMQEAPNPMALAMADALLQSQQNWMDGVPEEKREFAASVWMKKNERKVRAVISAPKMKLGVKVEWFEGKRK